MRFAPSPLPPIAVLRPFSTLLYRLSRRLRALFPGAPWCLTPPPNLHTYLSDDAQALSTTLQTQRAVPRSTFEALYAQRFERGRTLVPGQDTYVRRHKDRFDELFNACAHLWGNRSHPRILEFGVSEFSAFYPQLFPDWTLHLSDRPVPPDFNGFSEATARQLTECDHYAAVDLNGGCAALEQAPLSPHSYDGILFAEVLEHLDVHPVDLLRGLLGLLKPTGDLYLTTPNAFRREALIALSERRNPQAVYPMENGNWDRHHHHREFEVRELLRFARDAGGEIRACYVSGCLDAASVLPPGERSTLVLVIRRASAS